MKSPKERQRAYRERRKEHKIAGLTKLKILASATTAKRLEILSEIDNIEIGNVLGQAVELLWTQRFGSAGIAAESAPESVADEPPKPEKEKISKPEKHKEAKTKNKKAAKPEKKRTAKPGKSKVKSVKLKRGDELESPIIAGI